MIEQNIETLKIEGEFEDDDGLGTSLREHRRRLPLISRCCFAQLYNIPACSVFCVPQIITVKVKNY
tara:strand:- start:2846 stop:3043 length:198 start_codon:yes stop_codon:yes gene_type:complete